MLINITLKFTKRHLHLSVTDFHFKEIILMINALTIIKFISPREVFNIKRIPNGILKGKRNVRHKICN